MKTKKILLITLLVLVLLFAIMMAATVFIMRGQFRRGDYYPHSMSASYWYEDWADQHPREEVSFPSGNVTLKGFIYGAENTDKLLVFAHGIGSGHEVYINTLMWFVEHGWCVFAYDATGSGYSEGSSTVGLVQSALDLDSALTFVEQDARLKDMPKCVMGHSWGGFAAAAVLHFRDHQIKASVSLSGYADPVEMLDTGAVDVLGKTGATLFHPFAWLYNRFAFGEYAGLNAVDSINGSGVPILVIHGEDDTDVPYSVGVISRRDAITEPGAEFVTITGQYAHHHDYFNSDAHNIYAQNWQAAHADVGDLSREEQQALLDEVDRELVNEVNEQLFEQINSFLEVHLEG